jgi:hypothetical protein
MRRRAAARSILVVTTVVGCLFAAGPGPASAAAASGVYPDWQRTGAAGAWSVRGELAAAGFPVAATTSTASSLTVPGGASAFLGADTPFAQPFGSSQGKPYVNVSTAAGFAASTTKLTFATPTPAAGWGFALGDVDADAVQVSGTDGNGDPVAVADLGFESSFNYCTNSPKPSSCTGSGPFTDQPVWSAGSATLTGNGPDTFGAAGWFRPAVPLSSLTLTFTRQSGSPIFQLWLAAQAVPLTGTVDGVTPADPPPAPGVVLDLQHPDHSPVVDPSGDPVTATADANGDFEFPAVVDGTYRVVVDPPPRTTITGAAAATVVVDVSAGTATVPAGTFAVQVAPAATATTGPTSTGAAAPTSSVAAAPALAATGTFALPLLGLGLLLLLAGSTLVRLGRRGRHS